MLALFCLRLALGLAASLLMLAPALINPRFYRTHFLTVLGLTVGATVLIRPTASSGLALGLAATAATSFLGSVLWSLRGAPGGRLLVVAVTVALTGCLVEAERGSDGGLERLAGSFASAAVLGAAMTAMLIGHSYLIAPTMSLTPLFRLLAALAMAVFVRQGLGIAALWSWTRTHSLVNLDSIVIYWLPLRWTLGFAGPLLVTWMAWQSARIRSTQSATGILYVVVIFCFLGELTGQLLLSSTGYWL
jgi:cytochrome bd-type quinol oxidase subunit 2